MPWFTAPLRTKANCIVYSNQTPTYLRPGRSIFSAHLHIDRRGQPKVQSLVRDVRRLKEKCLLGKLLREVLPQNLHPFLCRPVLGGEQHQHIPIPLLVASLAE
jgi:hypothetical protein